MLKKLILLSILFLFTLCPYNSFAQTSDDDYSAQMKALREEHEQVKSEYIKAKKETRKISRQGFLSFGKTEAEKEARRKELQEAKEKEKELRESYLKSKEELKKTEKEIKEARKQARREQKGMEKTSKEQEKVERKLEKTRGNWGKSGKSQGKTSPGKGKGAGKGKR